MSRRHASFDESFADAQGHDTGNGALKYRSTSPEFPGVVCYEVHVYAKRHGSGSDRLWYEADSDPARKEFSNPAAALRHTQSLLALPDESLIAEAKRRGFCVPPIVRARVTGPHSTTISPPSRRPNATGT